MTKRQNYHVEIDGWGLSIQYPSWVELEPTYSTCRTCHGYKEIRNHSSNCGCMGFGSCSECMQQCYTCHGTGQSRNAPKTKQPDPRFLHEVEKRIVAMLEQLKVDVENGVVDSIIGAQDSLNSSGL